MKQIIVVRPNTLSPEDKQTLKDNGCIIIEHEDPDGVRVISQIESMDGDDVLGALIKAVKKGSYSVKEEFANQVLKAMEENKTHPYDKK